MKKLLFLMLLFPILVFSQEIDWSDLSVNWPISVEDTTSLEYADSSDVISSTTKNKMYRIMKLIGDKIGLGSTLPDGAREVLIVNTGTDSTEWRTLVDDDIPNTITATNYVLLTAVGDSVSTLVADSSLLSDSDIKSLISDSVATHDNFSELAGTVGDAQIADGAVDGGAGGEIADNSITADDLAANSVGNSEMADDAIGSAEMADADHGMVSWSSGSATVEDFALNAAADGGDQNIANVGNVDLDEVHADDASITIGSTDDDIHIAMDGNPDADDSYSGITLRDLNAGETITQWDLVYFDATDSEWKQADADASGEWPCRAMATAAGTDGNELIVLTQGVIENTSWDWTVGATLYLSDTAGGITETAPSTSGDCVQVIGWAISADAIYLNISGHWLEVE